MERFSLVLEQEGITAYFGETDITDLSNGQVPTVQSEYHLMNQMTTRRFKKFRKKLFHFTQIDLMQCQALPPLLVSSLIASRLIDSTGASIDEILWNKAIDLSLPVKGLESYAEQMEIFRKIPLDYQVIQLKQMIGNLSKSRRSLNHLITLYKKESIHALYQQGKKTVGPIRKLMLEDRNKKMVSRILEQMEIAQGPIFVSVGAAHLSGAHGILHGIKRQVGKSVLIPVK